MENNFFQDVDMRASAKIGTQAPVQQPTQRPVQTSVSQPAQGQQVNQLRQQPYGHGQVTTTMGQTPQVSNPVLPEGNVTGLEAEEPKGLVLTRAEIEASNPEHVISTPGSLDAERMANIEQYMEDYDAHIEETQEFFEERGLQPANHTETESNDDEEDDEDNEDKQEKFLEDYNQAVVIIDKTKMGEVHFTDEEREKLQVVKKIKVEEVEELTLESLTVKKPKKKNLGKLLKRVPNTIKSTNILLPNSGYTAVINGCSAHELLELMNTEKNALISNEMKWSLIYKKIETTSIGKFKDYNDFLEKTAVNDYDVFIYGILCATYPDIDTIPLTCQNCGKTFDHTYSVKSLIRAEKMSDELRGRVKEISEASHFSESAKACQENAQVNQLHRFKLPQSEFIIDLQIQSAYNFLYRSIKELYENENLEDKYKQLSILSTAIAAVYIEDPEDGKYIEFDSPKDIVEVIYSLQDVDIRILNKKIQEMMEGKTIEFGLMDMTCPHCRDYTESEKVKIDQVLFLKYQTSLTTEVE